MSQLCHSCTAPLALPDFKGPSDIYCKYCADENGALQPRRAVRDGIAQWLASWQPGLDDAGARDRAEHFMKAMPAWASDD